MRRLPLFPLPVVLFPGSTMPLHVFEPRYREMVSQCLEEKSPFGLLYHDCDETGPFLSEQGRVGSLAEIARHEELDDGRSLILIRGKERISLVEALESEEPFYEAVAEPYLDTSRPLPEAILRVRQQTLELFHAVLEGMHQPPDEVPVFDLNRELSFQLAPLIQIDDLWRQSLLELREEVYRLERLDALFQAAIDRRVYGDEGAA